MCVIHSATYASSLGNLTGIVIADEEPIIVPEVPLSPLIAKGCLFIVVAFELDLFPFAAQKLGECSPAIIGDSLPYHGVQPIGQPSLAEV